MKTRSRFACALLAGFAAATCATASAQGTGMPGAQGMGMQGMAAQGMDARRMSGFPIPSPDVPPGTVSVRLVRGSMSDNIAGHEVELHAGGRVRSARTDASGRAIFEGVKAAEDVRAVAVVGEERLESNAFPMPADSGVRLVLVAGAGSPGVPTMPPVGTSTAAPGDLTFGDQSRIHIEFEDDTLEVFYLFELVNPGPAPASPSPELTFELPGDAEQASALEGSQHVTVRGRTVTIANPLPPGVTPVRLAYSLASAGAARQISQRLPLAWNGPQVVMAQTGQAQMSSPQLSAARGGESGGTPFLMAGADALPAGQNLVLSLTGLPSRSHAGRNVALGLGLLVLMLGVWGALAAPAATGDAGRRALLAERRDRLMAELVRMQEQRRSGALPEARWRARHEELIGQLERVYGELDSRPRDGGPAVEY